MEGNHHQIEIQSSKEVTQRYTIFSTIVNYFQLFGFNWNFIAQKLSTNLL